MAIALWHDMHENWGMPFYGLFSFAHWSFPQKGAFAAKLSQFCASSQSTFGQCSSNHCNYSHKFAPFIWQCCQIVWSGKSPCSDMRRMRGVVDHSFNDVYLNNVGCLMLVYAMLDRTCTSCPDSFSPPCRLSGRLQAEKSLLIYFIKSDTKVLPWEELVNRFIMQRAALIMANDIPLMAIEDVIKAVCEYSPLRGR